MPGREEHYARNKKYTCQKFPNETTRSNSYENFRDYQTTDSKSEEIQAFKLNNEKQNDKILL